MFCFVNEPRFYSNQYYLRYSRTHELTLLTNLRYLRTYATYATQPTYTTYVTQPTYPTYATTPINLLNLLNLLYIYIYIYICVYMHMHIFISISYLYLYLYLYLSIYLPIYLYLCLNFHPTFCFKWQASRSICCSSRGSRCSTERRNSPTSLMSCSSPTRFVQLSLVWSITQAHRSTKLTSCGH